VTVANFALWRVHAFNHVKPGRTVVLADGCSYGDRATLQVPGALADELLAAGKVDEVDPAQVPDVATVPEKAK
jgi:hypothetical protein